MLEAGLSNFLSIIISWSIRQVPIHFETNNEDRKVAIHFETNKWGQNSIGTAIALLNWNIIFCLRRDRDEQTRESDKTAAEIYVIIISLLHTTNASWVQCFQVFRCWQFSVISFQSALPTNKFWILDLIHIHNEAFSWKSFPYKLLLCGNMFFSSIFSSRTELSSAVKLAK